MRHVRHWETSTRKDCRKDVCPLILVGVSYLLLGEHTAQQQTEPRDHGSGAGQIGLVVVADVRRSTDPVVAERMVIEHE